MRPALLALACAVITGLAAAQTCTLYSEDGQVLEQSIKSCLECQVTALNSDEVGSAAIGEQGQSPIAYANIPYLKCPEVSDTGAALCVLTDESGEVGEISVRTCADCVQYCLSTASDGCYGIIWNTQTVSVQTLPAFTCPAVDGSIPPITVTPPPPPPVDSGDQQQDQGDGDSSGGDSPCPVACPLIYMPLCMSNGNTAGNECQAKCEVGATVLCQGECPCPDPNVNQQGTVPAGDGSQGTNPPPTDPNQGTMPPTDPNQAGVPPAGGNLAIDPMGPTLSDKCAALTCPRIYMPVCLKSNKTVDNECLAQCEDAPIGCKNACPCLTPVDPAPAPGTVVLAPPAQPFNATPDSTTIDRKPECSLPLETGPCRAALERFGYDAATGMCKQYLYGGCQGNANRYLTQEACEVACMGKKPEWLCQAPCEPTLPQCQTTACPSGDCNAVYGFYEDADPIVLDVNSWEYNAGPNHPKQVYNAAQCCDKCKKTDGCNNWAYCSDPAGCGWGCIKSTNPTTQKDPSVYVGTFGTCNGDESFPKGSCRLSYLAGNVTIEITTDDKWTSGVLLEDDANVATTFSVAG